MRIGVTFPQIEFGNDPVAIRDYAQTIEGLGYTHFLAYDHVLGADTSVRPGWTGSYASENPFHEVFVLLGYLAGLTTSLELVTGVVILPQRQTALVAKQAAEVDVLSGGRLRLGVGVGWNDVEYAGLDKDFGNRGVRSEEQIALLRALWTSPVITFDGQWERIDAAGINPLPVQRPIPIWIGGYAEATLRRVGELGDGWFPWREPNETMRAAIERIQKYAGDTKPVRFRLAGGSPWCSRPRAGAIRRSRGHVGVPPTRPNEATVAQQRGVPVPLGGAAPGLIVVIPGRTVCLRTDPEETDARCPTRICTKPPIA